MRGWRRQGLQGAGEGKGRMMQKWMPASAGRQPTDACGGHGNATAMMLKKPTLWPRTAAGDTGRPPNRRRRVYRAYPYGRCPAADTRIYNKEAFDTGGAFEEAVPGAHF